jgi:hypothetical protein
MELVVEVSKRPLIDAVMRLVAVMSAAGVDSEVVVVAAVVAAEEEAEVAVEAVAMVKQKAALPHSPFS